MPADRIPWIAQSEFHARTVLWAALALGSLVLNGCTCTTLGCSDSLTISPIDQDGSVVFSVTGTVTTAGETQAIDCGSGTPRILTCQAAGSSLCPYTCTSQGIRFAATPDVVHVSLESQAERKWTATLHPKYDEESFPNGQRCEPTCVHALETVAPSGS